MRFRFLFFQRVVDLLLEMDKLSKVAELHRRWSVCVTICHDLLRWEDILHKSGIFKANPLDKFRRLALSHFKLVGCQFMNANTPY